MARTQLSLPLTACLLAGACGDAKDITIGNPATTGMITSATTLSTTNADDTTGQSTTADSGSGTAGQTTGEQTTGPDTTTAGLDTTTGETTAVDTSTTEPDSTGGTTSVDPILACLEEVEPGDECGECTCMNCLEEHNACQADEGCKEIRECGEDAGCSGIDCIGPCSDVINFWGGPFGPSGTLAQAVGLCVGEQCPGLCTP